MFQDWKTQGRGNRRTLEVLQDIRACLSDVAHFSDQLWRLL